MDKIGQQIAGTFSEAEQANDKVVKEIIKGMRENQYKIQTEIYGCDKECSKGVDWWTNNFNKEHECKCAMPVNYNFPKFNLATVDVQQLMSMQPSETTFDHSRLQ